MQAPADFNFEAGYWLAGGAKTRHLTVGFGQFAPVMRSSCNTAVLPRSPQPTHHPLYIQGAEMTEDEEMVEVADGGGR